MNLFRLAFNNVNRKPFRSGLVVFSVVLIVITAIWTIYLLQTIQENLSSSLNSLNRIGANIVVVPRGSDFAYSQPGNIEFDRLLTEIKEVPGVEVISPQLRLFAYENSPYCNCPIVFINAFDKETDFTINPWLAAEPDSTLNYAEAYAGSQIALPPGDESINLAGIDLKLAEQLGQTDTTLDQSLYVSFETAAILAKNFQNQTVELPGLESVYRPIVMVDTLPNTDPQKVANLILLEVQGVTAFESGNFFQSGRERLSGISNNLPIVFGLVWFLSEVFIGIVFSISVIERRRELGVMRVLGSSCGVLLRSILFEGLIIGIGGAVIGTIANGLIGFFFLESLNRSLQLTLASPSPLMYASLALLGLVVAITAVAIASIYPTWLVSRQDPIAALRG